MANVTYLIGAGASAGKRDEKGNITEGLPCVNEIPKRINNIVTLLRNTPIPINITWKNSQLGLNSKEDWDKAKEVVLNQFQELYRHCAEHATIDTYAKKLVLKREKDRFKHLEQMLTLFFMFEELWSKPDSRYDTFLANILKDNLHFPDNIRFISWNYDNQFEITYSEYNPSGNLLVGSKRTIFNTRHEITKINGTASFIDREQSFAIYRRKFLEEIQNTHENDLYSEAKAKENRWVLELIFLYKLYIEGKENNTDLSFAFDYNYPSDQILQSIDYIIGKTDVLVIIGYTFPFFNREIDRKILQHLKPNAKIYIQDIYPERIKQSLKAVSPDIKEENIILLSDVDQFYLPPEL